MSDQIIPSIETLTGGTADRFLVSAGAGLVVQLLDGPTAKTALGVTDGAPGAPGAAGDTGATGPTGPAGATGPNSVSGSTTTALDGILRGTGTVVGTVTVGAGLSYSAGSLTAVATGTNTGDQNLFSTIVVAGQSNVVSDSASDTLTLVAGTNITITTDAATDTITIAASGGGLSGTGSVDNAVLRADGTGGATLQNSAWVIADNATASPNNTVNHASLQATGGTTNVSVSIVPKGTGAFTLDVPDGASTGGNVRGANAIDLQTLRDAATQVAAATGSGLFAGKGNIISGGSHSVVLGGQYNTISAGDDSVLLGGWYNTISSVGVQNAIISSALTTNSGGSNCVVLGGTSHTVATVNNTIILGGQYAAGRLDNALFHASGRWSATGDRQAFQLTGSAKTTTNAAVEVNFGLGVGNLPVYVTLTAGRQISGTLLIQGIKSDGSLSARYCRQITIRRVSNTTTLDDSVTIGTDLVNGTSLSVTADDANDRLNISPTGVSGETWRWNCRFEGIEQAYGT